MRTTDDHRAEIVELLRPVAESLETERLLVSGAAVAANPSAYAHRVLADDVVAPSALPSFDNSQMDGYAVRSQDLAAASDDSPVRLPIARRIAAGDAPRPHVAGTATPVMTGAPIPPGADAVVPIERADPDRFLPADDDEDDEDDDTAARRPDVGFRQPVSTGAYVRSAGSDVAAGDLLLRRGHTLTPAGLGVVNGVGLTEVAVRRRMRVLLVPTGHEIRDPGDELAPGAIHDANSVALTAALQSIGCEVDVRPCRSDDAADLLALLAEGRAGGPDLVITVGGVSAGAREVVRDALGPLGVQFEKVAMQPGGPQGLGLAALDGGPIPVVSLPGNPVSALVSFEAFLRSALLTTQGAAVTEREIRRAPVAEDLESPERALQLRRGVLLDGLLHTVGGPSSHLLHSLAASTVLIRIPIGVSHVTAGDTLEFWRIDG